MDREIKFRGISKKSNQFIYGDLIRIVIGGNIKFYIQALDFKKVEILKETIGQFTCFIDSKRFAIYEGDIISVNDSKYIYEVLFEKGSFVLYHIKGYLGKWGILSRIYDDDMKDLVKDLKVIGSVHKNKELIQP